jgi:hypothetical protein
MAGIGDPGEGNAATFKKAEITDLSHRRKRTLQATTHAPDRNRNKDFTGTNSNYEKLTGKKCGRTLTGSQASSLPKHPTGKMPVCRVRLEA